MYDEDFIVTRENTSGEARLIVSGRIDSINSDVLQLKLDEVLKDGQVNIKVNMLNVDYLSSNGIRVILKAYKDAKKADGKVRIEEPSESVKKVLILTSLEKMLTE